MDRLLETDILAISWCYCPNSITSYDIALLSCTSITMAGNSYDVDSINMIANLCSTEEKEAERALYRHYRSMIIPRINSSIVNFVIRSNILEKTHLGLKD